MKEENANIINLDENEDIKKGEKDNNNKNKIDKEKINKSNIKNKKIEEGKK